MLVVLEWQKSEVVAKASTRWLVSSQKTAEQPGDCRCYLVAMTLPDKVINNTSVIYY